MSTHEPSHSLQRLQAEELSAWLDGQPPETGRPGFDPVACTCNPEQMHNWATYHLIGEAMRQQDLVVGGGAAEFLARWRQTLAAESGVVTRAQPFDVMVVSALSKEPSREAANDGRWRLVAGLCSMLAAVGVTWQFWVSGPVAEFRLAAQKQPVTEQQLVLVADPRGAAMVRDPQLDALLARHKQLGGVDALQGPSGFLRSATFAPDSSRGLK